MSVAVADISDFTDLAPERGIEADARPLAGLLRPAIDSNPPVQRWTAPTAAFGTRRARGESAAPAESAHLRVVGPEPDVTTRPDARRVRRRLVVLPGGLRPDRELPDVTEWSALLAVAIMQVLTGRRPLAQLGRWLSPEAVAEVGHAAARRRRAPVAGHAVDPQVLSVRAQSVTAQVVEVAAHVRYDAVSVALALRLEAVGQRWSCTAIDLGPRSAEPPAAPTPPAA